MVHGKLDAEHHPTDILPHLSKKIMFFLMCFFVGFFVFLKKPLLSFSQDFQARDSVGPLTSVRNETSY